MRGVITLCGSIRFKSTFEWVEKDLTAWEYAVLKPGIWEWHWLHSGGSDADEMKAKLDQLHFDKIMISDSIVVIDVDGYIGSSTKKEIDFAKRNDKIVYYLKDYRLLEKRGL